MFEKQKEFARNHIVLNSVQHFTGGFGIALVLQNYFLGNPFLPVSVGWILTGFALAVHLYENFLSSTMRKNK